MKVLILISLFCFASVSSGPSVVSQCVGIRQCRKRVICGDPYVPQDQNIDRKTAKKFWKKHKNGLKIEMQEHAISKTCTNVEYMNLYFQIYDFYFSHVLSSPASDSSSTPEFFEWFIPFIKEWIYDFEDKAMYIMKTAYNSDKRAKFRYVSEKAKFSTSVVDIFTQFYEGYGIIKKINFPEMKSSEKILQKFSRTINRAVRGYADMAYEDIDDFSGEEDIACTLMNNVEQLKVQLAKLYKTMENTEVNAEAHKLLKKEINNVLDKMVEIFVAPMEIQIHERVNKLRFSLTKVKAGKNSVGVDRIAGPLLSFLELSLNRYNALCEKFILLDILKELWKTAILSIQNFVILPGATEKNYLEQFPKDQNGMFDLLKSGKLFTEEQIRSLKSALIAVQDCLHCEGYGLERKFLDSTPEYTVLKYIFSEYFEKTPNIIKDFISNQKEQDSNEQSIGSLNVQINLDTDRNNGIISGKLFTAKNLKMRNMKKTDLKLFAKIYLVGPYHGYKKHKTDLINTNTQPKFNKVFEFSLNDGEKYSNYELVFKIKETSGLNKEKLLGIGVLKLAKVLKTGSISTWVPLYNQLQFDENGFIQLRILSQRGNSEIAKEFIKMMTTHTR